MGNALDFPTLKLQHFEGRQAVGLAVYFLVFLKGENMSHIVTIQTEVRDLAAIQAACKRLKLPPPKEGTFQLFSGSATGIAVELPGWRYPVVCQPDKGQLEYDNFGGRWGKEEEMHAFLQGYACERTKIEARKQGHSVTEQSLADGSVKLSIQVGEST